MSRFPLAVPIEDSVYDKAGKRRERVDRTAGAQGRTSFWSAGP